MYFLQVSFYDISYSFFNHVISNLGLKLILYHFQGRFAKFKKYVGHSAHVTRVVWAPNDTHLVSVGGADTAVMVWAHGGASERALCRGDSDDSDTDSEEEGGNSISIMS